MGAADRFLAYYGQMLDLLRQTLGEDCVIYVQSIPPVRPEAAAEKPGLASDVIRSVNEQLALLAAQTRAASTWTCGRLLADGEGNLKEVLAAPDGVHFSAGNGYGAWVTYLRNHAKYASDQCLDAWAARTQAELENWNKHPKCARSGCCGCFAAKNPTLCTGILWTGC